MSFASSIVPYAVRESEGRKPRNQVIRGYRPIVEGRRKRGNQTIPAICGSQATCGLKIRRRVRDIPKNVLPTIDYAAPVPKRPRESSDWGYVMAGSSAFFSLIPWAFWAWFKLLVPRNGSDDAACAVCC